MADRVTIQDIADALGVSRNTVSKAINNTGILADATRDRVLKKAIEMGYKQFSYMTPETYKPDFLPEEVNGKREIALFTTTALTNSHFASTMLDKFQREILQLGYTLSMYRVIASELKSLKLPLPFNKEKTAGILCIEMFDLPYSQMLCDLDIPVLFVDSPVCGLDGSLKADRLYMDNQSNIFAFVKEMVRRGKTQIGFIGTYRHCQSFFERYMGYRDAMYLAGLPCQEKFCFLENKPGVERPVSTEYQEYLADCLQGLDSLPDVFICANDFVALDTLHVFKKLGISVPQDVYLCGFDDSSESRIITPSLTTIHIHSQIMGVTAVNLLMSRIKEPSLNFRTVHTETDLIYRESTGD
ncbi:LacI family DNA-binding transcriptional regulator [Roseburia hominis]